MAIACCWYATATLGLGSAASAAEPVAPKRVVVIYPVSDGQPGILLFDQSLRSILRARSPNEIEIYNEYLDSARFADEAYQKRLSGFLRDKYADRKVDVVIPALAPSLDFVLKYRDEMFPNVPVVFGAIERREVEARRIGRGIVGIPMKLELEATLGAALRLHPSTRHVVVVAGKSRTDAYWVAEAKKAFRHREDEISIEYWAGQPIDELLQQASRLPRDCIIYYLNLFEDGRGGTFVPADVADRLCRAASVPVYGHFRTYLGRGIVGGRMADFGMEGENAARLASRVLAGERLETIIQPDATEPRFVFDWRQLHLWSIREEDLPNGSIVLFKEPSFWDLYKWRVVAAVVVCALEGLLIIGLLLERANRRRADERFRQSVVAAPSAMVMVARSGEIVLANPQAEALFGYGREELIGLNIDTLIPDQARMEQGARREAYDASPMSPPVDAALERYGRRKDGSAFPMEIGRNPIQSGTEAVILVSIVDIADRKRAEEGLRESQRELRTLTGRLLVAQETERRRIARELHDDLSQELALLAVHLDLLALTPPGTGADLGEKLGELSDRVKQVAASMHDLSSLLHPSKLEQLGLVPAVRSLCKDLAAAHGLVIELDAEPTLSPIPRHTALCLFRIIQEALRNVVKHSDATHARVVMRPKDGGAALRITDNGKGFDSRAIESRAGLGLISMRERLLLVGGTITIDSRTGAGTRIDVYVPLPISGEPPTVTSEFPDGLQE